MQLKVLLRSCYFKILNQKKCLSYVSLLCCLRYLGHFSIGKSKFEGKTRETENDVDLSGFCLVHDKLYNETVPSVCQWDLWINVSLYLAGHFFASVQLSLFCHQFYMVTYFQLYNECKSLNDPKRNTTLYTHMNSLICSFLSLSTVLVEFCFMWCS